MNKILFILLACILSCAGCPSASAKEVAPSGVLGTDALLDKIYAVHATRRLPEADYLRAGWTLQKFTPLEQAFLPKIRKTVHFALGELVRPVEGFMDWEDCPYAVVTKMRNLFPQLLNINCYDTFILGDLKLTGETYLVLPTAAGRVKTSASVVTYDPQVKSLRQAVDELIQAQGGWHIEMDSEDVEDELHPAYLNGSNINTLEFFKPLKLKKTCLAVGLRFDRLDGEHYRLSQIEQDLMSIAGQLMSKKYKKTSDKTLLTTPQLERTLLAVDKNFNKWSHFLKNCKWNKESHQAYAQLRAELKKWKCLIKEELHLRTQFNKTLLAAPKSILIECAKLMGKPDLLRKFIGEHREELLNYHVEQPGKNGENEIGAKVGL